MTVRKMSRIYGGSAKTNRQEIWDLFCGQKNTNLGHISASFGNNEATSEGFLKYTTQKRQITAYNLTLLGAWLTINKKQFF
jgi:hypothetical protein